MILLSHMTLELNKPIHIGVISFNVFVIFQIYSCQGFEKTIFFDAILDNFLLFSLICRNSIDYFNIELVSEFCKSYL
jgi:hypothetical protein